MSTDINRAGGVRPPRADAAAPDAPYVDWPAIFAGALIGVAGLLILLGFGGALGLSLTSLRAGEGLSPTWIAIAAGIWFVWVMVTTFGVGGYVAGRLRRRAGDATDDEAETRDGLQGLTVWALGALVAMTLMANGVGGAMTMAGAAATATGQAASSVASGAAQVAGQADVDADYFANLLLRRDGEAATDPVAQQEIAGILGRLVMQGELQERDMSRLADLVAARTDLDPQAARARVDEVVAEVRQLGEQVLEAAETARVTGVVIGFILAATMLAAAAAAYFGAALGGKHRDEGLAFGALGFQRRARAE